MKGYIAKKGNQFDAVIYEGLDPRHWQRETDLAPRRPRPVRRRETCWQDRRRDRRA